MSRFFYFSLFFCCKRTNCFGYNQISSSVFCKTSKYHRKINKPIRSDRFFYLQSLRWLLVFWNAAYWLLILAVRSGFWRHNRSADNLSSVMSLRLVYGCLSAGKSFEQILFWWVRRQTETLKLSIFCQNRQSPRAPSSHLAPGAAFIHQTLAHQGARCYFRLQ